jgi:hypothetical protein
VERFHVAGQFDVGFCFDNEYYDNAVYPIKPPGIFENVVNSGPGFVELGPKGKNCVYVPSMFHLYKVEKYWTSVRFFEEEQFLLPSKIINDIEAKLRLSTLTTQSFLTCQNMASRVYKNLPVHILDEVKNYISKRLLYNENKNLAIQSGVFTISPNPYAVLEEYSNDYLDSYDYESAFRIKSIDCNVPTVYKQDSDIRVGGNTVEEIDSDGNIHNVLDAAERIHEHWYTTCMFSLEGERKFVQYDDSDVNINKALKRLLDEGDNSDERSGYEKYGAQRVAKVARDKQIHGASLLAETCGVPTWVWKPDDHKIIDEAINNLFNCYICRFDRSWVQFVLDTCPEIGKWAYYGMFLMFLEYVEPLYSRWASADIPHVKRKLRQAYVRISGDGATMDIMVMRLEAKVKNEWAKAGKVPRLYVSYEAGCMYANELPEFVKVCMSRPVFFYDKGHFFSIYLFSKPRIKEIQDVFDDIARGLPKNEHVICVYSDDSVWAGHADQGPFAYNCDIKSCDASVKSLGFLLSSLCIGGFDVERAVGLVAQCKLPIKVRSTTDPSKCITIQRSQDEEVVPIEGSGTVMTTINNFNIMLYCIFVYISAGDFTKAGIIRAGIMSGLNLEVSENHAQRPERLDFLKMSPILGEDNHYYLSRNLGCILRGLGKVNGDLHPEQLCMDTKLFNSTPWVDRTDIFVSRVISSYCHEPSNVVLDSLRQRFNLPGPSLEPESMQFITQERNNVKLCTSSLAARYDLDESDLHYLANLCGRVRLGQVIVDPILTRVYNVDYGL